jgi:hypothetical protein
MTDDIRLYDSRLRHFSKRRHILKQKSGYLVWHVRARSRASRSNTTEEIVGY